jgi:hypothetical protein
MMTTKINPRRDAHRRLRRQSPHRSATAVRRAHTANWIGLGCNAAGIGAVTGFSAALFAHTVTGDCFTTLLARDAMLRLEELYSIFVAGMIFGCVPYAIFGFLWLVIRFRRMPGEAKRDAAERITAASWMLSDPLVFLGGAFLSMMIFVYGASLLSQQIHYRSRWDPNAGLRAQALAECIDRNAGQSK